MLAAFNLFARLGALRSGSAFVPAPSAPALLIESGFYLLAEDGGKLLLEA